MHVDKVLYPYYQIFPATFKCNKSCYYIKRNLHRLKYIFRGDKLQKNANYLYESLTPAR